MLVVSRVTLHSRNRLLLPHVCVFPIQSEQLLVRAALHYGAVLEEHDAVGADHRGEPVGHHHRRAAPPQRADGAVDGPLRARVQGRGGLVEQQDPGGLEEGPGGQFN